VDARRQWEAFGGGPHPFQGGYREQEAPQPMAWLERELHVSNFGFILWATILDPNGSSRYYFSKSLVRRDQEVRARQRWRAISDSFTRAPIMCTESWLQGHSIAPKATQSAPVCGGQCETGVAARRSAESQHSILQTMTNQYTSYTFLRLPSQACLSQSTQHRRSAPRRCIQRSHMCLVAVSPPRSDRGVE
jgi:hypothetical protein